MAANGLALNQQVQRADTLSDRMVATKDVLTTCEALVEQITAKIDGPLPPSASAPVSDHVLGIASLAMENHSRAIRIQNALNKLSDILG